MPCFVKKTNAQKSLHIRLGLFLLCEISCTNYINSSDAIDGYNCVTYTIWALWEIYQ